ncbi:MAG: TolC family protein [Mesorhizobium sp.]
MTKSSKKLALAIAVTLVISGCAVKPKELSDADNLAFGSDKLARADANQQPISGSVDLYEAMARALKYNLDVQVEVMEAALRLRDINLANYATLPDLVASSGYAGRNDADDTTPSTRDPDILTSDLTFSWNILDFGLSYVRAQQASDRALIQVEAKRKIVNRVIEDVRTAYWRAISYDRLVNRMRGLEGRVQQALRETRSLSASGDTSPLVALTYERELIEVKREIESLENELSLAKSQACGAYECSPRHAFQSGCAEERQYQAEPAKRSRTAISRRGCQPAGNARSQL